MTRPTGAVTMKDVAEVAEVSVSTVSLALRDNPRIPEATRQKIKETAAAMGFVPNIAGSALRATKPRLLGLLANVSQELHYRYIQEVRRASAALGYQVAVEDVNGVLDVNTLVERFAQVRIRSLIVVDPVLCADTWQLLESKKIPLVVIGQQAPVLNADLVTSDNTQGANEIARVLAEAGVAEFTYLDGPPGVSAQVRRRHLEQAASARGLTMRTVAAGATLDAGYSAVLAAPATPALVCYNDQCAEGAFVALSKAGRNIPRDTMIIGFDDSRIAQSETFCLTSVSRNPRLVATIATDMAVSRDGGYRGPPVTLKVPTTLIERASSATGA